MCVLRVFVGLANGTTFNQTLPQKTTPVNFSVSSNLFNTTIECSPGPNGLINLSGSASVSLDAGADVNTTVGLGAVVAGTIIPPGISQFSLSFGAYSSLPTGLCRKTIDTSKTLSVALDGTIDANLSVAANVTGQISSGSIDLFEIGIPGLSFPG